MRPARLAGRRGSRAISGHGRPFPGKRRGLLHEEHASESRQGSHRPQGRNIAGMLRRLLLRVQRPRYTVDLGQTVAAAGWQGSGAAFTTAWNRGAWSSRQPDARRISDPWRVRRRRGLGEPGTVRDVVQRERQAQRARSPARGDRAARGRPAIGRSGDPEHGVKGLLVRNPIRVNFEERASGAVLCSACCVLLCPGTLAGAAEGMACVVNQRDSQRANPQ